jgi:hypothetical protein
MLAAPTASLAQCKETCCAGISRTRKCGFASSHPAHAVCLQIAPLRPTDISISPTGSLLAGSQFTLTATVVGGSLTVVSSPASAINCPTSSQAGSSVQAACTVDQAATAQQYPLQVTWLTPAQQTSSAGTQLQVVSAGCRQGSARVRVTHSGKSKQHTQTE